MAKTTFTNADYAPRPPLFGTKWFLGLSFLVLVVYPLSTGPVYKFNGNRITHHPIINTTYKSLFVLSNQFSPVYDFLSWYIFVVWRVD